MKTCRGVEVYLHAFLTSMLDGGDWSASPTGRLTPGEISFSTHLIGSWLGLRAGPGSEEKISLSLSGIERRSSGS